MDLIVSYEHNSWVVKNNQTLLFFPYLSKILFGYFYLFLSTIKNRVN